MQTLLRSRTKSLSQSDGLRSSEPARKVSNYSPSTRNRAATVSSSPGSLPKGTSSPTPPQPLPFPVRRMDGVEPNPNAALPSYTLHTHGIQQPVQPSTHPDERHSRKSTRRRAPPGIPIPSLSTRSSSRGRVILVDTEPQNIPTVSSERSPTRHLFLGSSRLPDTPPPSAYDDLGGPRSPTRARSSSLLRASKRGTQPLSQGSYLDEPFRQSNDETFRFSEDTIPHASVSQQGSFTIMNLNKPLPSSPPSSPSHQSMANPKANSSAPLPPISFQHPSYGSVSLQDDAVSRFGRLSSTGDSGSLKIEHENAYTTRSSRLTSGHQDSQQQGLRSSLLLDSVHDSNNVESQVCGSKALHQSSESLHQQQMGYHFSPLNGSGSPTMTPVVNHLSAFSSVTTLPARIVASLRPRSIAPSTRSTSLAHSARSTSVYTNESPYLPYIPITTPQKLSFSKRLKKTFSFRLSRTSEDVGRGVQESLDSPSLNRRSSTFYGDSSTIRTFHSESQIFSPLNVQTTRKLRKKRPSSIVEASTPPLTSEMPSSILEPPYPHPKPALNWSPMRRVKSSPSLHQWIETPPPVPPLPVAFKKLPHAKSSQTPRQSTGSLDNFSRKQPKSSSARSNATLLPATSPPVMGSRGPNLSAASRSRSTPNILPRAVARLSAPNPQSYTGSEPPPPQRFLANSTLSLPSTPPLRKSQRPISLKGGSPSSDILSHKIPRSNRRWTLAASEVPDERVVSELDRLRSVGWWLGPQGELIRVKGKGKSFPQKRETEVEQDTIKEKAEDEKWRVARQALMVCREIVRTERSYREAMARLQRGEVGKGPPPILLQYLPALISASQAFSERLDYDPSTWGVSAAFIGVEDDLETALVAWSGIVGEFFFAKGSQRRRWSTGPGDKDKDKKAATSAPVLPRIRSVVDTSHQGQETYDTMKSSPSTWRMSMPALSQLLIPGSEGHQIESQKPQQTSSAPAKTPTVHDLAIQPTQRVMRYVLLYKDLLNSTPVASPARPFVEHALKSANRIAQKCNRAQDNAASLT